MAAVAPYDLFFFEEPLHYTDPWGYAELCRTTSVPIAGGECLTAAYEWRVFVEQDAFDIGQPDAAFTGGLVEFLRVASMLEARGRKIATHSWASGGGFMQNLHFGFAAPNTVVLRDRAELRAAAHRGRSATRSGCRTAWSCRPRGRASGIVLTEEIKARFPFVPGSGEFNSVPGKILVD